LFTIKRIILLTYSVGLKSCQTTSLNERLNKLKDTILNTFFM